MRILYSVNISNADIYKNRSYYEILHHVFTKHMKIHVQKKQNIITFNINEGVATQELD